MFASKTVEMGLFRQCFKAEVKFLTQKSYPDLHHLQGGGGGVLNLPQKFNLYLIIVIITINIFFFTHFMNHLFNVILYI